MYAKAYNYMRMRIPSNSILVYSMYVCVHIVQCHDISCVLYRSLQNLIDKMDSHGQLEDHPILLAALALVVSTPTC